MKKVLSFVLVLAMVLGSVAMAFAVEYSDVKAEDKYSDAIGTLSELGVLNGYEDGTFKADRTIKRSEFAKVVIEALGLTPTAASAAPFSDVDPAKWYAPYVALAAQLGIVNGFGDGTFRPDQTITDTQAIVMIVRALGYTDEYFGGYNAAKYISQATALQIMKDVNAGTGSSTRGNVAQLVYNSLGKQIVKLDKDGAIDGNAPVDSMQRRLAGAPYMPDASGNPTPFVYDGSNTAPGANLTAYLGKYVTAAAKGGKISGISTVLSKTLEGTVKNGKFTADGTAYTFYPAALSATPVAMFVNGEKAPANSDVDTESAAAIAIEVELSGTVITDVYSISTWTPSETLQVAKDTLDVDGLKFATYAFTPDKVGKIDTSSFDLVGVDKLEDITEGNVVTVYEKGGAGVGDIIKLEVGTKTVAGAANEQKANGDFVIGGTTYAVFDDGVSTAASAPTLGTSGTAYLAYNGDIFAFEADEEAAATANYAILMKMENGNNGISTANARVQLFTADGKTTVLAGSTKATTVAGTTVSWTTTANAVSTPAHAGKAVVYTLNGDGQVTSMDLLAPNADTAADVSKTGAVTPLNAKLLSSSVIIEKTANGYTVAKAADLFGTNITYSAVKLSKDGTAVEFMYVEAVGNAAGTAGNYVVFNGASTKLVNKTEVTAITALKDGAVVNYTADPADVTTAAAVASTSAVLYNVKLNGTEITEAPSAVTSQSATTTTKTAISNGFLVFNGVNQNIQVADNAVVYVWKTNAWTVGSLSDIATSKGADFTFYDLTSPVDGVYDVVFVVAK